MGKAYKIRDWIAQQGLPPQEALQAAVDQAGGINKAAALVADGVTPANLKRFIRVNDIVITKRFGGRKRGGAA